MRRRTVGVAGDQALLFEDEAGAVEDGGRQRERDANVTLVDAADRRGVRIAAGRAAERQRSVDRGDHGGMRRIPGGRPRRPRRSVPSPTGLPAALRAPSSRALYALRPSPDAAHVRARPHEKRSVDVIHPRATIAEDDWNDVPRPNGTEDADGEEASSRSPRRQHLAPHARSTATSAVSAGPCG